MADRTKVAAHTEMYVDIGAHSAARAAELGIAVGDPISFVSEIVEFGHDARLVAGKAIDDRLGCAVLWSVLEAGAPPAGTFVAAFTSQEEVGPKGAGIAGERIRPPRAGARHHAERRHRRLRRRRGGPPAAAGDRRGHGRAAGVRVPEVGGLRTSCRAE